MAASNLSDDRICLAGTICGEAVVVMDSGVFLWYHAVCLEVVATALPIRETFRQDHVLITSTRFSCLSSRIFSYKMFNFMIVS